MLDPPFTSQTKTSVRNKKCYHLFSNHKLIGNIELGVENVDIANGDKILVQEIGNLGVFDKN